MKKIFFLLLALLIFYCTSMAQCPQASAAVLTTHHGEMGDPGAYNSFGVRITLNQVNSEDVTVRGVVFETERQSISANFSITVTSGYLTAEADNLLTAGPGSFADVTINTVSPCTASYAGVTITYDVTNNILKFTSISDVYIVLEQLDDDYNDNYDNYDSQLDTSLSVHVLDSLDEVNGFDPRVTFRNFENLFSSYNSKRMQVETTEIAWLDNDFAGTNPSDIDFTFDDALNTIFNSDYSFKIGEDLYSLTSEGFYLNGIPQDENGSFAKKQIPIKDDISINKSLHYTSLSNANVYAQNNSQFFKNKYYQFEGKEAFLYTCKTNKKKVANAFFNNGTERYELEVAIHSIGFRSGVHGKVIHFKKNNNGKWKRSRAKMATAVGGGLRNQYCNSLNDFIETKPDSGFKKGKN